MTAPITTVDEAVSTIETCIDLLEKIPNANDILRSLTVNQIRQKLWELREQLAAGDVVWVAGGTSSERLTSRPKQKLLNGMPFPKIVEASNVKD